MVGVGPDFIDVDGLVPLDGGRQAIREGPMSLKAEVFQFLAINVIAKVVEGAIRDSFDPFAFVVLMAVDLEQLTGHFHDTELLAGFNVVDVAKSALVQDKIVGTHGIINVKERTSRGARTVDAARHVTFQAADELGNELLRKLMRAIDVVGARNDERKLERLPITFHEMFRRCLGRRIGVRG